MLAAAETQNVIHIILSFLRKLTEREHFIFKHSSLEMLIA